MGVTTWMAGCKAEHVRREGTLIVAAGPDRYNLSAGRSTFTVSRPNAFLAEPPLRVDPLMHGRPWLLAGSQHLGDGLHRVRIRPGIRFHNGEVLNARNFAESAREFIAPRDFIGLDAKSIKPVAEDVVEMQSTTGSAWMIDTMTHAAASVFRVHRDWRTRPEGTGPYRLVRYESQECLEVERFEDYWGDQSRFKRVQYRFLPDPQGRLMALQRGEADLVSEVVPEMLAAIDPNDPRITVTPSRSVRYAALLCNVRGPAPFNWLSDIRVRRALALSINRDAIRKTMYGGFADVGRGVLPSWMYGLGEAASKGFEYNRIQAEALLDEAGWLKGEDGIRQRDGRRLQLRLVAAFPNASVVKPLPEIVEQMFRAIGVATEIIQVEDGELYYSAYADRGEGDLFLELAGGGNSDPTYLLSNIFHSKAPWRFYRFIAPGERVDSLIDAARAQTDRKAVVDLIREAHRRLIDEEIAAIPILMVPNFVLCSRQLEVTMNENLDWVDFGATRRA